jgi:Phosphotransferase system fructose-specific component IIB
MDFVAITSCPAGLAHTPMAAKALEKAASELGLEAKVEQQGAMGLKMRSPKKRQTVLNFC